MRRHNKLNDKDLRALADTFAKRLEDSLLRQGMTQGELARAVRKTPSAVSRWLTERQLPGIPTLRELAITLKVSTDWLLDMPSVKKPKPGSVIALKSFKSILRKLQHV